MNRDEVITEFCRMAETVRLAVFNNEKAADCFCTNRGNKPFNFQFESPVIKFIKDAVDKAVQEKINAGNTALLYKEGI